MGKEIIYECFEDFEQDIHNLYNRNSLLESLEYHRENKEKLKWIKNIESEMKENLRECIFHLNGFETFDGHGITIDKDSILIGGNKSNFKLVLKKLINRNNKDIKELHPNIGKFIEYIEDNPEYIRSLTTNYQYDFSTTIQNKSNAYLFYNLEESLDVKSLGAYFCPLHGDTKTEAKERYKLFRNTSGDVPGFVLVDIESSDLMEISEPLAELIIPPIDYSEYILKTVIKANKKLKVKENIAKTLRLNMENILGEVMVSYKI